MRVKSCKFWCLCMWLPKVCVLICVALIRWVYYACGWYGWNVASFCAYLRSVAVAFIHTHTDTHTQTQIDTQTQTHTYTRSHVCISIMWNVASFYFFAIMWNVASFYVYLRSAAVAFSRENPMACTYERVMAQIWISHGTHMNESWHTYEWVMAHT